MWAAPLLAAALITTTACDQGWPTEPGTDTTTAPDVGDDTTVVPDVGTDTGVPDTEPDPVEDTSPPCEYPTGSYGFSRVGDLVPPSTWPTAVLASDETAPADLEAAFCNEEIESIFVFIATPS
jgi:hypothetical protein